MPSRKTQLKNKKKLKSKIRKLILCSTTTATNRTHRSPLKPKRYQQRYQHSHQLRHSLMNVINAINN